MGDEAKEAPTVGNLERVDEVFANSRLKIELILELLAEKLQKRVEELMLGDDTGEKLTQALDHLERLIFMGQMNRAKTKELLHLAPKKYHRVLSDAELTKQLRPVRDETNFPKRGPRGKREDAAGETPPEEP